jgi:uncharacterized BrkB/YihY/UPF0761 family membrane protein
MNSELILNNSQNNNSASNYCDCNRDDEHLKILSWIHWFFAIFKVLTTLFLITYFAFLSVVFKIASKASLDKNPSIKPLPSSESIVQIMLWLAIVVTIILLVDIVFQILTAIYLPQKKHWWVCFTGGILNCLSMPFGTLIGVCTLIVLTRSSVENQFKANAEKKLQERFS